jgi:signal transduction histidine kinase
MATQILTIGNPALSTDKIESVPVPRVRLSSRNFVLAILVAATFAGVIFYCRQWVLLSSRVVPIPRPFRMFLFEMLRWYLWVPFAPLALRLIRNRAHWPKIVAVSAGVLATYLVASVAVRNFIVVVFFRSSEFSMDKMATQFRNSLVYDSLPSLLTLLAILGAAYAWHQHDRSTRLEAQLSQAELQALRAQLQPHFLFNTLNSISVLLEEDPKAANQMLLHLSDLLRVMTQRTGSPEISLREELDLIRTYLEIEQTRFRDRLTVRFENDPAALDARIPSLLLQPLVENAVRHGVAPRSTPGLIHISTHRNNGSVRILIRDNGPGIPADNSARPGHGVGLSNTRARLELLYGKDHRFTLENAPGGGLESLIEIPYRS